MSEMIKRVEEWVKATFPKPVAESKVEAQLRFLEEAIELVQALELPKEAAQRILDRVYSRAVGEPGQEMGGVVITMNRLAFTHDLDPEFEGQFELDRIWNENVQQRIRDKQSGRYADGSGVSNAGVAPTWR